MFKYSFLVALLFPLTLSAQRLSETSLNKIRLIYPDKTVQARVLLEPIRLSAKASLNYYWYKANTIQITQGGYSGQLLNGPYTEFFSDKNLKTQGTFKLGLKTGEWKTWRSDGTLVGSYHWKAGLLSGKFVLYTDTGGIASSGFYRNGLLNGVLSTYRSKDSVEVILYRKGKIVPPKKPGKSFMHRFDFLKRKKTSRDSIAD